MLRNAIRRHEALSLLMIDLDFFKRVNDVHGHPEGDRVLEGVGAALRGTCRQSDLAARYGGEEFEVALPDTDERGSMVAAENFRVALNSIPGLRSPLTASIGAVTFQSNGETPPLPQILRALISSVDMALYAAKRAGRNCVRHANAVQDGANPPGAAAYPDT
jgi:diguanylate cyclase (GGDEF)-like protein